MKKVVGYIISAVGLAGLLMSGVAPIREAITKVVPFELPAIVNNSLMIGSLIVLVVGVVLLIGTGKSKQKEKEVPIYEGKEIVGYRRK